MNVLESVSDLESESKLADYVKRFKDSYMHKLG